MGIFSRFRDIVSANINSILDKAEDPEKMVRLMIQEMEDTLIEVKSHCAGLIATQKRVERELTKTKSEAAEWESRATLSVNKGREDLARIALNEKRRFAKRVDSLEKEVVELREMVAVNQSEITQLETKMNDAREKQRMIIKRRTSAVARHRSQTKIRQFDTSEAFAKFEAYENGIERMEAEADLVDSLRPKATIHDEFADLEHSDEIEAELEELKKRVQSQG
jgi:phage shock protein A